jgi:starch synthase
MSRILMVTSEAAPFAKTGGLADVLGALPPALAKIGEEVVVVMPKYRVAQIPNAVRIWGEMPLAVGPHLFVAAIDQVEREGVRYLFVDCPELYGRAGIYNEAGADYPDNHIRFALLNQAAIGIARQIFRPDIFHGHDWQAGLLAPYLRENYATDPALQGIKCVLTIHNLGYQGVFPRAAFDDLGLSPALYHPEGLEFWGQVNLLKAGIVWSDAITTVSPTYAKEIQTPEHGFGLEGVLLARANRIHGILNGIDNAEWDPETDPHVRYHYSARRLTGKPFAKFALLREMKLPLTEGWPLIGMVSRFADQKGFDLFEAIAPQLLAEDVFVIVLGSGDPHFERLFRKLAADHPDKVAVKIGYDNGLAHRIEAGSDLFLMPSRYEPCGLSQMYSLRYGTIPVVRATGGLEDTVDETTGFKFTEYSPEALWDAIERALAEWQLRKPWRERMRLGMTKDFSWNESAVHYQQLYRSL